jgi:hypothetical protein
MSISQTKESETPRTDKSKRKCLGYADELVPCSVSEEIERDLNESKLLIEKLKKQLLDTQFALKSCLEDSIELIAERCWWKNEHRCGYSERYMETVENILQARSVLGEALRAGEKFESVE